MSKSGYIGIEGKARKISRLYVGVNDVARKIKKAYIGVNGKAQLFYNGGELVHSASSYLSSPRQQVRSTNTDKYVLFGGGGTMSLGTLTPVTTVEACDIHGVVTNLAGLQDARKDIASATIGNYAMFAGGWSSVLVDAYDFSLNKVAVPNLDFSDASTGGSTEKYAFFSGGGYYGTNIINAYDSSLVKFKPEVLKSSRGNTAIGANKNHIIIAGGHNSRTSTSFSDVDCYNNSLTKISVDDLDEPRYYLAGVSNGDYILFAGGESNVSDPIPAYAYNKDLVKIIVSACKGGLFSVNSATSLNKCVLIASDGSYYSGLNEPIEIYDESLTKTIRDDLFPYMKNPAASSVKGYAFFGGGSAQGNESNTINIITTS